MEKFVVWPDGTVCLQSEAWEFTHKSDDYVIVLAEDEEDALNRAVEPHHATISL